MDRQHLGRTILHAAADLPVAERFDCALALCGADARLRDEVRQLWESGEWRSGSVEAIGDRFRIICELGAGGMATVYLAQNETGKPVALKVVYPGAEGVSGSCPLRAEYAASAAVKHLNVRRVDELFTWEPRGGRPAQALVMEYIEGETLAARIRRGPLEPAELLPVARGLSYGLDAIHDAGLIHGDLKPANIILRKDGTPVIVDLGSSDSAASPDYMSPDRLKGRKARPSDDVFSFGAILYEMAMGKRPWPDEALLPAAIRRATEDSPALVVGIPGLADAVAKALHRDSEGRGDTARGIVGLITQRGTRPACRHRASPARRHH